MTKRDSIAASPHVKSSRRFGCTREMGPGTPVSPPQVTVLPSRRGRRPPPAIQDGLPPTRAATRAAGPALPCASLPPADPGWRQHGPGGAQPAEGRDGASLCISVHPPSARSRCLRRPQTAGLYRKLGPPLEMNATGGHFLKCYFLVIMVNSIRLPYGVITVSLLPTWHHMRLL